MTRAYYNEIDPYAAQWLRNLIAAGHIAPGDVDERDIRDVKPHELAGYTQCHFFAGIGVWSHAARLAGIPDDFPLWTGSCPCQPFSAAGRRGGVADERHLWPHWFHLISVCRPPVVFGEQVASKDGLGWLDLVHADLEGAGYSVGAADLCAAGVGAPHIRQRLWFVADAHGGLAGQAGAVQPGGQHRQQPEDGGARERARGSIGARQADRLGDPGGAGLEERPGVRGDHESQRPAAERAGRDAGGVADASGERRDGRQGAAGQTRRRGPEDRCGLGHPDDGRQGRRQVGADAGRGGEGGGPEGLGQRSVYGGPVSGFWRDADWLPCRDGKARPVEPGTFPLAHGAPARVGRLRAYGNAIVAPVAAGFIEAWIEAAAECQPTTQQDAA